MRPGKIKLVNCQEDRIAQPPGQAAWYLLQCKSAQCARAQENLVNQGFTCFLPMMQAERVRQGRRQFISEPLFPGYLFIYLDSLNDNWSPIRSTRGVSRLVGFGGQPLPVAEAVIDALRVRISQQPGISILQPGDKVRITSGAFADIEAIFHAYAGDKRVILLLNLMNRAQQLHLPVNTIARVASFSAGQRL